MERTVAQRLQRLRSRGGTYAALLAPVVALLLFGVALPFVVGEPVTSGVSAGGSAFGADAPGATLAPLGSDGLPINVSIGPDGTTVDGPGGTATTVLGGPAGPGGPGGPTATTPSGGGRVGQMLTASDVGVTPTEIKVAVFVPNLGGFAASGFAVDLGDSRAGFEAFLRELNAAGGINGRKVTATYIDFDPLQDASMRDACLQATEDQKVFATFNINGFYGPGILCVTQEHKTPLMEAYYSEPDEWYQRSAGLYITAFPSKSRALRNLVEDLHARGLLKGRTIGLVDSDYPFDKVASDTALIPTLNRLGYKVAHRSTLSSDTATSQAQIPLEVQRMQSAGVDTVFFAAYFVYVTTWVQQASNRQFTPQYLQSDYANGTADGGTRNLPASYDGAIGITSTRVGEHRLNRPPTPDVRSCIERWNKLTGQPLEPNGADETFMVGACGTVDTFAGAARSSGPNLTRKGLVAGYAGLGTLAFPQLAPFSWTPSRLAGGDQVRTVRWSFRRDGVECKCWIPVDDFRPARG